MESGIELRELSVADLSERMQSQSLGREARSDYLLMYSSWFGGFVRDPAWMMVPIDDHMVHRGDGIFEAFRSTDGRIFGLDPHLERLAQSARMIGLELPMSLSRIRELTRACVREVSARERGDLVVRIFVSRGPGSFTISPAESVGSQIYIVVLRLKAPLVARFESGVRAGVSRMPCKEGLLARVKSCNYLPNVLMKMEARERQLDFTVGVDHTGHISEGATENFGIVSQSGEFWLPPFENTLRGITALHAFELAQNLVERGLITAARLKAFRPADVACAREAMFFGTTIDCLACVHFEDQAIGNGRPGPVARALLTALRRDPGVSAFDESRLTSESAHTAL